MLRKLAPAFLAAASLALPLATIGSPASLGYKQAKYVMGIEIVDSFGDLWGGKGGFWEDRGYEWCTGI